MASPERIVLSGGVMLRESLFPKIRRAVQAQLNGYIQLGQLTSQAGIDDYIAPSHWGNNAGLVGALTLAQHAYATKPAPAASSAAAKVEVRYELTFGFWWGMAAGALLCAAASRLRR